MATERKKLYSVKTWFIGTLVLAATAVLVYKGMTFDAEAAIQSGGVLAVAIITFMETGFLIGTVLPGDSLLVTAGVLASHDVMPIIPLILAIIAAGIAAYNVAYSIGRQAGTRLFKREDGFLFRKDHVTRSQQFYEKYGAKSLVIARFVPMVRSFAPLLAGVAKMPRRQFMLYNVVGSVLWGTSITLVSYWLGNKIPGLEDYLKYFIVGSVAFALLMTLAQLLRDEKSRAIMLAKLREYWQLIRLNKRTD